MSTGAPRALSYFALCRFTREYWALKTAMRREFQHALLSDLQRCAPIVDIYQVFPAAHDSDICVWLSVEAAVPEAAAQLFQATALAMTPHRLYLEAGTVLWGYSRPSEYSNAQRSAQAIDPFSAERLRYLVIYPFTKTAEWYVKPREERQALMNEHIAIGKQYTEVRQLLLYSTGLQDQEFVAIYEMDDLRRFSELVTALRSTQGRPFTLRDTPVQTCVFHPAEETLRLFL